MLCRKPRIRQHGTTLIETAVALVIVALMIATVAKLFGIWHAVITSVDVARDCRAALHIVRDRAAASPQTSAAASPSTVTVGRCTAEVVNFAGVDGVHRVQIRMTERTGMRTIERTITLHTDVR